MEPVGISTWLLIGQALRLAFSTRQPPYSISASKWGEARVAKDQQHIRTQGNSIHLMLDTGHLLMLKMSK